MRARVTIALVSASVKISLTMIFQVPTNGMRPLVRILKSCVPDFFFGNKIIAEMLSLSCQGFIQFLLPTQTTERPLAMQLFHVYWPEVLI